MRLTPVRALIVLAAFAPSALAAPAAQRAPVVVMSSHLGKVLGTKAKLAFYTWEVERKAGGRVRCTGACARAWPPVLVTSPVARRVPGIRATFGTVRRPNGKLQLTVGGLPVYTYEHDTANVVLCDNVDGWFAIRAR
jgi:predicted lipoprotein with Yx(FWY)xxD motif